MHSEYSTLRIQGRLFKRHFFAGQAYFYGYTIQHYSREIIHFANGDHGNGSYKQYECILHWTWVPVLLILLKLRKQGIADILGAFMQNRVRFKLNYTAQFTRTALKKIDYY